MRFVSRDELYLNFCISFKKHGKRRSINSKTYFDRTVNGTRQVVSTQEIGKNALGKSYTR